MKHPYKPDVVQGIGQTKVHTLDAAQIHESSGRVTRRHNTSANPSGRNSSRRRENSLEKRNSIRPIETDNADMLNETYEHYHI